MGVVMGVVVGIVVALLAVVVVTKLVSVAIAGLITIVPSLLVLWFIIMILKGMARSIFK